jgi:glucose-1-phosphate adenylyltransferase
MGDYNDRVGTPGAAARAEKYAHMGYRPYRQEAKLPGPPQLTRSTIALILAGGRGERLAQLTDWRCKPAVPFGGKFRIIDFTLSNCVNSGIRRIGVLTQYKAQSLIRHVQRGWSSLDGRLGEFVELLPAQQRLHSGWYQGTADALFQNLDILRRYQPRFVLVLAGDHVYKMDYGRMLADHVTRKAEVTVGATEIPLASASSFGVMSVDADLRVCAFAEKPRDPVPVPGNPGFALASMGIYVFDAPFLYDQLIRDAADSASSHDFGRDLLPGLVGHGCRVFAHSFRDSCVNMSEGRAYWRDVGTVDAYWEANMELAKVTPDLNLYDRDWPMWTYQEQLPPAKFVFDDEHRRGAAIDSMVSGGCLISGSTVRRSLLFSDVRVHSFCQIEESVILPNVDIDRHATIRRAVIDKYCQIPKDARIGVDHDEDRRRYHVTPNGITLVTPEMLGQRVHHAR